MNIFSFRYKPIDVKYIIGNLRDEFETIFRSYYVVKENRQFLDNVSVSSTPNGQWYTWCPMSGQLNFANACNSPRGTKKSPKFDRSLTGHYMYFSNTIYVMSVASNFQNCYNNKWWTDLITLMKEITLNSVRRAKMSNDAKNLVPWQNLKNKLERLEIQLKHNRALAFAFVEGALVRALQKGKRSKMPSPMSIVFLNFDNS